MKALLLVALIGCTRPGSTPAPPPPASVEFGPRPGTDGRILAVIHYESGVEECSGAGGEHATFEIDEPGAPRRLVHAGGHAQRLGLRPRFDEPHRPGPYFVAEVFLIPETPATPRNAGWCLGDLPRYAGEVVRALPARDLDDARRILAELATTGMSPPQIVIDTKPGHEDLGIARVVANAAGMVSLERVAGVTPEAFADTTGGIQRDDVFVVASTHGRPTRLLAVDDLASARRWLDIARRGWPQNPSALANRERYARSRWTIVGTVERGRGDCPNVIRATSARYTQYQLLTDYVAVAPPGAAIGTSVIAVTVPMFERRSCGVTVRAIRSYDGRGVTVDRLLSEGIPADRDPI